jgi:hypothetical protein
MPWCSACGALFRRAADALQARLKTLDRTIKAVAAHRGEIDLQVAATAERPSTSHDPGRERQECGVEDGGGRFDGQL